ncbi:MAG: hypothetical protein J6K42_01335 [Clostridia bacterium]|nr:hypothetical protein [Clostridia bacterium]
MKLFKSIIIVIIGFLIIYCSINTTYADTLGDIIKGGDDFTGAASGEQIFNEQAQKEGTSQLYFITLGIGIAAAAVVGMILGIQFVITGVEGKAKVKEKFIPYVIGCIVIFGGFGIWGAVVRIAEKVSEPTTQTSQPTQLMPQPDKDGTSSGGGGGGGNGR